MKNRVACKAAVSLLLGMAMVFVSGWLSAQTSKATAGTPELIFSTYLGGSTACDSCSDVRTYAQNAASDTQGNTYVTGATTVGDLPVLHAFQPKPAPNSTLTAFVAKYDPAGKILWLTYLGGNNKTTGIGVAAMPDGGVAVAGLTGSDDSGPFPTKHAFQDKYGGKADYFVSVFDANGNLRYSSYLGGSEVEGSPTNIFGDNGSNGNIIATDEHGLVYVTGATASGGDGGKKFPVTDNAVQPDLAGGTDSFLTIVDPGKSGADSLVYSSFLGGKGHDKGHSIVVNSGGELITASGYTSSPDFPTTSNGYRDYAPPEGFSSNGFVAQFKSSKPGDPSSEYTMLYSTYLGADSTDARDDVYGTALDLNGLILATGRTRSAEFPMTGPGIPFLFNSAPYLQPGAAGDQPFLVKIDPSLDGKASLVYSTFLGGGSKGYGSFCTSVGADSQGKAYVAGETNAPGVLYTPFPAPPSVFVPSPTHFPYTADALITSLQGEDDVEFMQVTADGEQLGYSTYLGGKGTDRAYGLAVDPTGNVVVAGITSSRDFPLKNPAQQWPGGSTENAFVTKFAFASVTGGGNR